MGQISGAEGSRKGKNNQPVKGVRVDMGWTKKKVSSKSEKKMHTKMKRTSRRAENLVHVQQHCGKYFYKKIFF